MAEVASIFVLDKDNVAREIATPTAVVTALAAVEAAIVGAETALGQTTAANSLPVTLASDQWGDDYETVAASQTDQTLGPTGAANDLLEGVLIIPATTSPGAVSIKDGSGSAITIFTGGASSVTNLVPFLVPLRMRCGTNWKVTTGANVSAIAFGSFT